LQDPPNYWDNIVWPAYLSAHRPIFENGNIETGPIDAAKISGVTVLEASEMGMEEMVERACGLIYEYVSSGKTARDWSRP
jgi:nicotinamide/nicotinate riboside kinase